jgi:peroxiredoxin
MRVKILLLFGLFVFNFIFLSGCAIFSKFGGEQTNYALAKNGATVNASNFTQGKDLYTVINGITSSDNWDGGEGWECKFSRRRLEGGGWSRLDPRTNLEYGSAWLEVQFKGEKMINKITLYPLNSAKYPASRYGIKEAWMQVWKEYGWTNVGEIQGGNVISKTNLDRKSASGKIEFKFDLVKTDKIRLVVFQSNDVQVEGSGWTNQQKNEISVARVIEIEATGVQSVSGGSSDEKWVKVAPEIHLQGINGQWFKLSDNKGKIVIVVFWAAWSPESQQEVRELNSLNNQYKDQNVIVVGISVDEGGAERISGFVQSNGLGYPILIADTDIKSAYGGIGKLPSTFVIDQKGNIVKEYLGYRGGHLIDLDVKKLLQEQ